MQLDIKNNIIQTLVANNGGIAGDYDKILLAIVSHWLTNDPKQSWDKLGLGLQKCGYAKLTDLIEGVCNTSEDSMSDQRKDCELCMGKVVAMCIA